MSDWDERFASLQRRFRERIDQVTPKGDPIGFAEPIEFVLIRGFRDLAREARAQLAQRDGEIETLRAKVNERGEMLRGIYECITVFNHQAVYDLKVDILAILNPDSYNSALSDNPESPALADKEA